MQFSNPILLWGLLGLSIPIGIHLLSRKEGKIIKIGSVRHLEDADTKQFKSIRLNEVLLLAIRCLLITVLVFALSGVHFSFPVKKENWLLIEKSLEQDKEFQTLIDSLGNAGFKTKFLSSGFPDISDKSGVFGKVNYWKLAEDLESRPLESVVVLSFNYLKNFAGKRPPLPDNIRWISKIPAPVDFTLFARQTFNDSILIRSGKSDSEATRFSSEQVSMSDRQRYADTVTIESTDPINISIVSDTSFFYDKLIILAALKVLEEKSKILFQIESSTPSAFQPTESQDWILWITAAPIPQSIQTHLIQFREDRNSDVLFQLETLEIDQSIWMLTRRLNEEIALEKNLTLELGLVLLPQKRYSTAALNFDRRILPEQLAWADGKSPTKNKGKASSSSHDQLMAGIFLALLLGERLVAFNRKQ
jgi:hypothetical protein